MNLSTGVDREDQSAVYGKLKEGVSVHEAAELWKLLDKRAEQPVYNNGSACSRQKVCNLISLI